MYNNRQRSQSLFECPLDKVNGVDKSRELYFLRLEQMNNKEKNPDIEDDFSFEKPSKEKEPEVTTKNGEKRSQSIWINKSTRQRRSSTISAPSRGLTEDMVYLADVAGSFEVRGRLEDSPSPDVEFIPPHKAQFSYDSYLF